MSELGDLLELLHGSGRFRTVRAEIEEWRHRARALAAFQAMARSGSAVMMYAAIEDDAPQPEVDVSRVRLWLELPDRARVEREGHLAVRDGKNWWTWSKDWGSTTNVGADEDVHTSVGDEFTTLLSPAKLMGALEWTPLGREGDRVHASSRPRRQADEDEPDFALHSIGGGADEYRFELDARSGTVLRVEALLDGEPFQRMQVLEMALDEELPPETWVFEAPDGAEPAPLAHHFVHHELSVPEIIERASFTVLAPERVPSDWELTSTYVEARERPPMAEHVSLRYRSADGTASVNIGQSAPGGDDDRELLRGEHWEERERDGVAFRIRPRSRSWRQPQLYIEREGTGVMMISDTLANDELIELALALRPVRR